MALAADDNVKWLEERGAQHKGRDKSEWIYEDPKLGLVLVGRTNPAYPNGYWISAKTLELFPNLSLLPDEVDQRVVTRFSDLTGRPHESQGVEGLIFFKDDAVAKGANAT